MRRLYIRLVSIFVSISLIAGVLSYIASMFLLLEKRLLLIRHGTQMKLQLIQLLLPVNY